jgi:hypothetical protein
MTALAVGRASTAVPARHVRFARPVLEEGADGVLVVDSGREPLEDDGAVRLGAGERAEAVLLDADDVLGGRALRGRVVAVAVQC